jgi:hypothetical protein
MGVIGTPFLPAPDGEYEDLSYDPHRVDLVLVEMLAAAYYLTISPDIIHLEQLIREELGCA